MALARACCLLLVVVALTAAPTPEQPAAAAASPGSPELQGLTRAAAEEAFERLKTALVGQWEGRLVEIDSAVEATFYLTGNDSALVEDIRRPDKPAARMHSVYHLADGRLQLTHYCSYRNQPRLLAERVSDDGRTVEFRLLDVSNLSVSGDRYTHRMVVSLSGPDQVAITYVGIDEEVEGQLTAQLRRKR